MQITGDDINAAVYALDISTILCAYLELKQIERNRRKLGPATADKKRRRVTVLGIVLVLAIGTAGRGLNHYFGVDADAAASESTCPEATDIDGS